MHIITIDKEDLKFSTRKEPTGLRGYDAKALSDATGLDTGTETLVQQSFAEEADINTIVHRFGVTGQRPFGPDVPAVYGDFTGISDYESALAAITRAEEGFMKLPPEVRLRFGNDPGRLVEFARSADYAAFEEAMRPDPAPVVEESPPLV